ncbi:hypothetical protein [Streptomyces sp. CBMA156]|uniref:hypothetical protein n=1 Tax=Streptomyces sp. CBMA156 TaxID=1930280 RepID=UPI001661FC4A|nr:hypothetical protein [Streptomyces sp. CBMA156]MBD0674551.1 hypothetical protein [Streptomyces sp. CBMA156]
MSKRRLAVPGAAVAALTLAALLLPAAAAATAAPVAPLADSCTQNWSISSGEGYANGKWCNYNTKVVGTVHDTKADGRCPYVSGKLSNGGHVDSDWAGGKGKSRSIAIYAPSNTHFTSLSMRYIGC